MIEYEPDVDGCRLSWELRGGGRFAAFLPESLLREMLRAVEAEQVATQARDLTEVPF